MIRKLLKYNLHFSEKASEMVGIPPLYQINVHKDYTRGPLISTSAISEEKEDILSLINNIDLPSNVTMVTNLK